MIAIIDYDAGNLKSVEKALLHLGEEAIITRDREQLLQADKVILPGVGNFGDAMNKLHHYQLVSVIREIVDQKTPFLGICLGMQVLFESSDECKGVKGLSILEGDILRIPDSEGLKIPHMGWNSLTIQEGARLYRGIEQQAFVYFVHSYYLKACNSKDVVATTHYSTLIDASVERDNVYGCQFHPEKSGELGLQILKNFAHL
ncbi:MAG: Imidazole glycerol phosphate synthase subunit HisH [Herbinix sp.]|jgi:glutamine amidotransferase|nr:Imidazole glycerol phosphate synthase subunit HisH [Herbinix sp.]